MSHLDRLARGALERCIPLSVLLELTGRCNLDCRHCYLDVAHPPAEMTTAQALLAVDRIADAGALFLALSGGELLLREDALDIATHARARGLGVRLLTNATRVDRALARRIAALEPLSVEVSLYGAASASHDAVTRRAGSLRRSLRGIVLLRRAGVRVGIKAPLLAPVCEQAAALLELGQRLGAPVGFDPLVTPRHDGDDAPLALRASTAALARVLADPRVSWPSDRPPAASVADDLVCAIARRTCRVAPDGRVYPCPTYPEPVGDILAAPLVEIWRGGPVLDRLRALRRGDLRAGCEGCTADPYCSPCPALARLEAGNEARPCAESCRVAQAKAGAALDRGHPRAGHRAPCTSPAACDIVSFRG